MPYEITKKEHDSRVLLTEARISILKAVEDNDDLSLVEWVAVFLGLANRMMMDVIKEEGNRQPEPPWIPGNRPEKEGYYQIDFCGDVYIDEYVTGEWQRYAEEFIAAYKEIHLSAPYQGGDLPLEEPCKP